MPNRSRAQRPTLTYAQMYGSGYQEGMGIWGDIGRWIKGAASKANKFLKKTKLLSKVGGVLGPMLTGVYPQAGRLLTGAAKVAGQAGYGVVVAGGAYSGKCKNISRNQHMAMQQGMGRWLPAGGISLAAAKPYYPGIKNISPGQVSALAAYRGRRVKGGGISLALRKAVKAANKGYMAGYKAGMSKGSGYSGMGLKLSGQGPYVGMGVVPYKKKRHRRRKPVIVYRM